MLMSAPELPTDVAALQAMVLAHAAELVMARAGIVEQRFEIEALKARLAHAGADLKAGYVGFTCFDGYSTSLDMASALHPQTILAVDFLGKPLAPEWGASVRLRIATKRGFKSAKNLQSISVSNSNSSGYKEKQGYDWFSGV